MRFEGHNGRITLEGDDLVLSRVGVKGRFGGELERRIALDDVEGAFLRPPSEARRPGYLQLVVVGEPEQELTLAQAVVHPDVVTFSARQQPAFERLQDWLENGGELREEDPAPGAVTAAAPRAAALPTPAQPGPAAVPVAAAPAEPAEPAPPATSTTGPGPEADADSTAPAPATVGPAEAVRSSLSKYAVFAGRARRSEFWWFFLLYVVAGLVGTVLDAVTGLPVFALLAFLGLFLPLLSVLVRRMHDIDRRGWWYFISFVPGFGPGLLLSMLVTPSQPGDNRWGPSPKPGANT